MLIQEILNENLGNLAQLNAGPLINVLRQAVGTSKRWGSEIHHDERKFNRREIGASSEIVDVGVIKDGIKGIRKAYKANISAEGFAVYIGGKIAALGIFNIDTLAGSSRIGRLAYDLTPWSDTVAQLDQAAAAAHIGKYTRPPLIKQTSLSHKKPYSWEQEVTNPKRMTGVMQSTGDLSSFLSTIDAIAKAVGQPVTAKLILFDKAGMQTRSKRYSQSQINTGVEDLKTRLVKYKQSKLPTINTIQDFVKHALENPGKKAQFGGTTYMLTPRNSYNTHTPIEILKGTPFEVRYESITPGRSGTLDLLYKYDRDTNMLLPIKARWTEYAPGAASSYGPGTSSQEAVVDPKAYIKSEISMKGFDKFTILRGMMAMSKEGKHKKLKDVISALRLMGEDWPELSAIENSISNV